MHVRTLLTGLSQRLQLPAEVVAGIPKLELTGQQMLSVEPHKGLLEYGTEEIRISSQLGPVQIRGKDLRIALMNSHRITVEGTIQSVEWLETEP